MTPAILNLQHQKTEFTIHEYAHDPSAPSYGLEAAEALGTPPEQVFKTLVVEDQEQQLAVAIVPVSSELNLKAMAKSLGSKRVKMADREKVERSSGYVLGGVSPFGQKKQLRTILDQSAQDFRTIFVSGGRRGLEVEVAPADLLKMLSGKIAGLAD